MPVISLRLFIDISFAALACLACWQMGKDLNVDMLSYHLYSANAFWNGTYAATFMGAGSQSYINPIGYLPFFWMIKAGWHSYFIAASFAVGGALSCMILWRMGVRWIFANHPHALPLSLAGALLGGLSPLFLATLGTSFLDPLQASLFCLSLYITADGLQRNDLRRVAVGGMVLGFATGIKLSLVHLTGATLLAILVVEGNPRARLLRLTASALGAAAGAALSAGFWAWHLWSEYGNPVFPFANLVFKSPDFPPVSLGLDRFAAESWLDLLTLPIRMVALKSGIYAEIAVPDIRFALAGLLAIAWLVLKLAGRTSPSSPAADSAVPVMAYLASVLAMGYATMVLSSGNGRYFLPIFILIGPAVCWLVARIMPAPRYALVAIVLILAAQAIHGGSAGYRRWDSAEWTKRWIDVEVPTDLENTAHSYLFSGSESDTFIAAFLHPASKYLMLQGKNPLSPNREGASRVRAFLDAEGSQLRVLARESETRASTLYKTSTPDPVTLALINDDLAAWNLRVSEQGCRYIGITLGTSGKHQGESAASSAWPREYSLLSCPVLKGSAAPPEFHMLQARLEKLSDILSAACPPLFPAPPSFPIRIGDRWFIRYAGSDVVVSTEGSKATLTRSPFGPFNVPIGHIDSLMAGKLEFNCRRLPRR